jgi:hypothetical protein
LNFCIHKYFYENSPSWKKVREEENAIQNEKPDEGDETEEAGDARQYFIQFEPMDKRALASLAVLRSRIVKLLENSENSMFPLTNIAPHVVGNLHHVLMFRH